MVAFSAGGVTGLPVDMTGTDLVETANVVALIVELELSATETEREDGAATEADELELLMALLVTTSDAVPLDW